jgi:hypothetical protein
VDPTVIGSEVKDWINKPAGASGRLYKCDGETFTKG